MPNPPLPPWHVPGGVRRRVSQSPMKLETIPSLPSIKDPIAAPKVVNRRGEPIVLSSWQKNRLYAKAKELKRQLEEKMCTRRETHRVDNRTVRKMRFSEFASKGDMQQYSKMMQAIGADPKDCSAELIRRRGE